MNLPKLGGAVLVFITVPATKTEAQHTTCRDGILIGYDPLRPGQKKDDVPDAHVIYVNANHVTHFRTADWPSGFDRSDSIPYGNKEAFRYWLAAGETQKKAIEDMTKGIGILTEQLKAATDRAVAAEEEVSRLKSLPTGADLDAIAKEADIKKATGADAKEAKKK